LARTNQAQSIPPARARHLTTPAPSQAAVRAQRKFLRYFPGGFADETYVDWERGYKARAAERWQAELGARELRRLVRDGRASEVAARAVAIESRTNLLYSFEKMALRDAVGRKAAAALGPHDMIDLQSFIWVQGSDEYPPVYGPPRGARG
jgi:hypothetical protein